MGEFQLKKASRSNVKLRVGIWGPSGSGKTMGALLFAKGLVGDWEKIAILDTENGSGELYSHLGEYNHCEIRPPFSPKKYVEAINYIKSVKGIDCLIVDSISHEWEGEGGCLELHARAGGKFQDWAKITPLHKAFVDCILQAPFHVVLTGRTKIDYSIDRDDKNKTTIKKVGLKTITREGLDYEMTLAFSVNIDHYAIADKDRTNLFSSDIPFLITEDIGKTVRAWNERGEHREINQGPQNNQSPAQQGKPTTDYMKDFVMLGRELCGSDVKKWDVVRDMVGGYNKAVPDQSYWLEKLVKLKKINKEDIDGAMNFMDVAAVEFSDGLGEKNW